MIHPQQEKASSKRAEEAQAVSKRVCHILCGTRQAVALSITFSIRLHGRLSVVV